MKNCKYSCINITTLNKRKADETANLYLKRIQDSSRKIFVANDYYYKGKPIKFNILLTTTGAPLSFAHATTSKQQIGKAKYKLTEPDENRLARIHWIDEIFTTCVNCKNLIEVKSKEHPNRIYIVCKERLYLIVLQESKHKDSYHFVTAFPITQNKYETIESEYSHAKRK